jgi:hypothetical protein
MTDLFRLILGILASRFKARATLEAENLVLRQQVNVETQRRKRPIAGAKRGSDLGSSKIIDLASVLLAPHALTPVGRHITAREPRTHQRAS